MSNTNIVTLEVVLTVQRLVHKFGAEQDSLTWDLILDITEALIRSLQVCCRLYSRLLADLTLLLTFRFYVLFFIIVKWRWTQIWWSFCQS